MERESFKSRLGFLLVSAGCAIGIGNVWRFPFIVGQNGGGFFVLIYLIMLVIMGLPVLTMELAVGRASRKSAVLAYKTLEKKGSKWHIHGWFAILGCYVLMMYYTNVSGWMLNYFFKFATGTFKSGMNSEVSGKVFSDMLANPKEMGFFMAVTVIAGVLICSFGVQKGLERVSKVMMSALFVLILILAVHSFTLSGAKEGLRFYLVPNIESVKSVGLNNVLAAAMNQSFFTLSLGIAAMEIFGSYMSRETSLLKEGAYICLLDTFVAVCAGLIIFPACFSFGVEADSGPSLIFVTLPNVFVNMSGGRVWGALFFLFMTFASFSTVIAVFENIMASCMDNFGWSRKKTSLINGIIILIISVPCVLGYNVLKSVHIIGARDILDSEDFIVSNLLLPLGSLVYLLFCTTRFGWGFKNYQNEANLGKGLKVKNWMKWYFIIVLPIMITAVFLLGLF